MIDLITTHSLLLAFIAGLACEYFGAKIAKRIELLHPGKSLEADLVTKVEAIVDAKLAANSNKTTA